MFYLLLFIHSLIGFTLYSIGSYWILFFVLIIGIFCAYYFFPYEVRIGSKQNKVESHVVEKEKRSTFIIGLKEYFPFILLCSLYLSLFGILFGFHQLFQFDNILNLYSWLTATTVGISWIFVALFYKKKPKESTAFIHNSTILHGIFYGAISVYFFQSHTDLQWSIALNILISFLSQIVLVLLFPLTREGRFASIILFTATLIWAPIRIWPLQQEQIFLVFIFGTITVFLGLFIAQFHLKNKEITEEIKSFLPFFISLPLVYFIFFPLEVRWIYATLFFLCSGILYWKDSNKHWEFPILLWGFFLYFFFFFLTYSSIFSVSAFFIGLLIIAAGITTFFYFPYLKTYTSIYALGIFGLMLYFIFFSSTKILLFSILLFLISLGSGGVYMIYAWRKKLEGLKKKYRVKSLYK